MEAHDAPPTRRGIFITSQEGGASNASGDHEGRDQPQSAPLFHVNSVHAGPLTLGAYSCSLFG